MSNKTKCAKKHQKLVEQAWKKGRLLIGVTLCCSNEVNAGAPLTTDEPNEVLTLNLANWKTAKLPGKRILLEVWVDLDFRDREEFWNDGGIGMVIHECDGRTIDDEDFKAVLKETGATVGDMVLAALVGADPDAMVATRQRTCHTFMVDGRDRQAATGKHLH